MNHLVNCGEPLSEPFRDYYFKKVSRIVASVSQTFLFNIPYIALINCLLYNFSTVGNYGRCNIKAM